MFRVPTLCCVFSILALLRLRLSVRIYTRLIPVLFCIILVLTWVLSSLLVLVRSLRIRLRSLLAIVRFMVLMRLVVRAVIPRLSRSPLCL